MRSATVLALSLMFVGAWSHDSARGQTSVAREASPPVIGGPPPMPNPAADYDGFSVGTVDDNDASSQATPPVRSRAAKGAKSNSTSNPDTNGLGGQSSIDQEDEALKRKLTICKNCK
ncbi:hypothetical protein [Bradyrhizobium sp.]|uniref:hypothetical protein n=1 Tax=Bradyrhizobium sp. TaxID=376 RepID=UPI0007C90667|nr:hypothetical protein [Bradyrhizobium sp.]